MNTTPANTEPVLGELSPPATAKKSRTDWRIIAIAGGITLVLVLILVGIVYLLTRDPARTANIRDIIIILFAFALFLSTVVTGALLAVIAWQMQMLIGLLRNEVKPMLGNVNDMVANVRGTTMLVSESIAKPTLKLSSFWAGLKGAQKAASQRVKGKFSK